MQKHFISDSGQTSGKGAPEKDKVLLPMYLLSDFPPVLYLEVFSYVSNDVSYTVVFNGLAYMNL